MTTPSGSFFYDGFVDVRTILPLLMCPSDKTNPKLITGGTAYPPTVNQQGFHSNYIMCSGNATFYTATNYLESANLNGLIYPFSQVTLVDITDGASNTVLGSELILVPDTTGDDTRGRIHNAMHAGSFFTTLYPPNTTQSDREWYCLNTAPRAPCINAASNSVASARSYHGRGVNVLFADGSIRFVSDNVSVTTWNALGSRNGGENPGTY